MRRIGYSGFDNDADLLDSMLEGILLDSTLVVDVEELEGTHQIAFLADALSRLEQQLVFQLILEATLH